MGQALRLSLVGQNLVVWSYPAAREAGERATTVVACLWAAFHSSEEAVTSACRGRSLCHGNIPTLAGISEAFAICRASLRPVLLGRLSVVTELFSESSSVVTMSHLRPVNTSHVASAAEEVNRSFQPQLLVVTL